MSRLRSLFFQRFVRPVGGYAIFGRGHADQMPDSQSASTAKTQQHEYDLRAQAIVEPNSDQAGNNHLHRDRHDAGRPSIGDCNQRRVALAIRVILAMCHMRPLKLVCDAPNKSGDPDLERLTRAASQKAQGSKHDKCHMRRSLRAEGRPTKWRSRVSPPPRRNQTASCDRSYGTLIGQIQGVNQLGTGIRVFFHKVLVRTCKTLCIM